MSTTDHKMSTTDLKMSTTERIHAIALSTMFATRAEKIKQLYERLGSATAIVEHAAHLQDVIEDFNPASFSVDTNALKTYIDRAQRELEHMEAHHVRCLIMSDADYPQRVAEVCPDAPLALYYCGNANLNARHTISIVGTRNSTEYGRDLVDTIVGELAAGFPNLLVVSGLAYGTDINAHRAAGENNLPTVAVLAHGLDRIYPSIHRNTATRMVTNGGLLTEYPFDTSPEPHNFLRRNRIIAALSEATLVVESKYKGGSLTTARLAAEYGQTVMACPGRVTDNSSIGCNNLIVHGRAMAVTSAADIIRTLDWHVDTPQTTALPSLFDEEMTAEERMVYNALDLEGKHINTVIAATALPVQQVMGILNELEFRDLVRQMPGSKWRKKH